MINLTQNDLKKFLSYDSLSGDFTWMVSRGKVKDGNIAGYLCPNGYIQIGIYYKEYYAHRLAWLYTTGKFPKKHIDHINRNKADNRFSNLRECDVQQNLINRAIQKNNTSGYKGVSWFHKRSKWVCSIKYNRKTIYIGTFDCKREAARAYNKKAKEIFGEFAYLNEIIKATK